MQESFCVTECGLYQRQFSFIHSFLFSNHFILIPIPGTLDVRQSVEKHHADTHEHTLSHCRAIAMATGKIVRIVEETGEPRGNHHATHKPDVHLKMTQHG